MAKYDNPEDIKSARKAAKEKGNKTFTVDGLRYDTSTGRRKPLSAAPLLEATQRRIDFEKARDKKENKGKKPQKKSLGGLLTSKASQRRQSGAIMDSKLQPVRGRKNGGFVTKWERKWG